MSFGNKNRAMVIGESRLESRLDKIRVLSTLTFGHASTHWCGSMIGPLIPVIAKELNLTFTQVGLLFTARSIGAAVSGATVGVMTDIIGKRKLLLVVILILMGVVTAVMGYAESFVFLLFPFAVTGMLIAGWHPPSMSAISKSYPERRGFALGLHGSGASLAQAFSPLLAGYLLGFYSWQVVMKSHFIPPFIAGIIVLIILPNIVMETSGSFRQYASHLISSFRKSRGLVGIALISGLRAMCHRTLESFLPVYLAYHYGMSPYWIGFYIFLIFFSGTIPEAISGLISDRIGRRGLIVGGLSLSTVCLSIMSFLPTGFLLGANITVLGFSLISLRPIIVAAGLDIVPSDLGGSAIAFIFSANQIFGSIGPLVTGILADRLGVVSIMIFIASLTLISAFISWFLKDAKKLSTEQR